MYFRFKPVLSGVLAFAMPILTSCGSSAVRGENTAPEPQGPSRIVAIGDLHGDLNAAKAALELAGAMDSAEHWIGKDMAVVQTGDILDRGDQEKAIMELFKRLGEEAKESGGAVYVLNGNHELMNAYLDFRYVTDDGFKAFGEVTAVDPADSVLASLEPYEWGRAQAFRPGGPMALELAKHKTALILQSTLFTHGGILPGLVDLGLDKANEAIQAWLRGEAPEPEWILGDMSPVWARNFSDQPDQAACDTLSTVLDRLGVQRMVVGHTVQTTGITAFCGGRVWCIDVGLASYYGGRTEVLEIRGDVVRSLR